MDEKLAKKEIMRDLVIAFKEARAENFIVPEIVFEILETVAKEHKINEQPN